jgi:hypothetical protein
VRDSVGDDGVRGAGGSLRQPGADFINKFWSLFMYGPG